MHAALAELNQRLAAEGRVRLEVHTGVNTGEVAEATEEAGDRPVDPELLATLTGALAAAFDQGR
jgi:hypothetical protein